MKETMRAVLFYAPKEIRIEEVPLPRPGPGEVLIKIGAALTCGTDFKAYRQGHKVMLASTPSLFGHEMSGTIMAAGAGVENFRAGQRVVAGNSAPCEACYFCAHGQSQLCDNLKLHNGAYAEYNLIPAHIVRRNLYVLEGHVNFTEAALAEPLACAIHAVEMLGVRAGESVAILGAGSMSLLLIQALAARRAQVIVVGRNLEHLKNAQAAGAHSVVSALESDPVAEVRRVTEGRGADCVFEAVGKTETWQMSLDLVRKGGRVCLFGGCASGTMVPLDAHRIHYSQISLHGVFHHTPRYFKAAVELIASGQIKASLLVPESIRLDDLPSYFELKHRQSNPKAAVIP
ncbi:MAG: alcohol dehydrogenase catalytic domain-containing protein [Elusimicrobia bacterium]|nr:alcohol dehydrogenase catalytic domain-containing protein [Elusimicrobiota bacterium]